MDYYKEHPEQDPSRFYDHQEHHHPLQDLSPEDDSGEDSGAKRHKPEDE